MSLLHWGHGKGRAPKQPIGIKDAWTEGRKNFAKCKPTVWGQVGKTFPQLHHRESIAQTVAPGVGVGCSLSIW